MIALLAVHTVLGVSLIVAGARADRRGLLVGSIAPAVTLVWLVLRLGDVLDGDEVAESVSWVPELGLTLDFRLDGLAAVLALLVSGIGVLVFAYAIRYFSPASQHLGRLAGLLTLFAGSMLGLVLTDHLLMVYVFWELTSVTSYLLIGHDDTDLRARAAALQAIFVTGAGGLAMLGGFVLLGEAAGTYSLQELLADPPSGGTVPAALVLILLGAFTKSAQYPFHSWLPAAMAAPTPISAYLHSATMVKAGVYLVARLSPAFVAVGLWRPLVVTVGLLSLVGAGLRALRQYDLKLLLAYGTISQLGLMMVLFGAGTPEALVAGSVLLVAHALFKAALFMVVGVLDHQTGTRDLRFLPPLGVGWAWVKGAAVLSALSMAGIPLLLGYVAKESAYEALLDGGFTASAVVTAGAVAGSVLTVAYSARFLWGAFVAPARRTADGPDKEASPAPAVLFVAAPVLLAAITTVSGTVPGLWDKVFTAVARSLGVGSEVHLALWHGWTLALVLSMVTIAAGALLFLARGRVEDLLDHHVVPSGERTYLAGLRGLDAVARRLTGVVQNGSLPVYAGVILATAAVAPGIALLLRSGWAGWPVWIGTLAEVPLTALLLSAAMGAALVRRRFSAAVFLGVSGYAMAGLFVAVGAPDLALTQAVIETLTTVVFVLVLRRLPDRFERQSSRLRRTTRVAVAATVAVAVFAFALIAAGNRITPPISDEMVARSVPDAHGRNVVNVILVDFRGLDTLGEITVLATASIGAVALARAVRRPSPRRPRLEREGVT